MALPAPGDDQGYWRVSALEAGHIQLPLKFFIAPVDDAVLKVPVLAFLLQHSTSSHNFLFDLGIPRDWQNLPPNTVDRIKSKFVIDVPQDIVAALAQGRAAPSDIHTVCLSHCHFDHAGDPTAFPTSTFVVGAATAALFQPGYPADPNADYPADLLPPARTRLLSFADAPPLGPFPHALDFHGDGSLYIVDAPGHLPGHINVLARTAPDGAWVLLAGDTAHHWDLITGRADIAVLPVAGEDVCAHADKASAEAHIRCVRQLCGIPRVRVLLSHDEPWYAENNGGPAFWPGEIPSL